MFTLGRQHTGWGRIHAVEALIGTGRPDIRRWLLTEGFRNDVTWGYLALLVARNCGLAVLLAQAHDRLLNGDPARLLTTSRSLKVRGTCCRHARPIRARR